MSYDGKATCDKCGHTYNFNMDSPCPRAMDHRYFEGYMDGLGWHHFKIGKADHWICPRCKTAEHGGVQTAEAHP